MSKIVIALGGNALGKTPSEQITLLKDVSKAIVDLISLGNEVVITHGNGPQVGQINLAMDYAANGSVNTPFMPFPECGSMSQGYIGYQIQQQIYNELQKRGIKKNCVSLITQVLVDEEDEAFENPTKPIGMFYTKEEAINIEQEKGYHFTEDAGRGYRRVVPSPIPKKIIEGSIVKELLNNGDIVIAVGGGGIPVIDKNNTLIGVDAVIDKDRSASKLAKEINADILLILTSVDKVYLNYNKENQIGLDTLFVSEAYKYLEEEQFAKGSMLPKIEACLDFVKDDDSKTAIITSLSKANDALNGTSGTVIKRR